jgi:hypothetical protein
MYPIKMYPYGWCINITPTDGAANVIDEVLRVHGQPEFVGTCHDTEQSAQDEINRVINFYNEHCGVK